MLPVLLFAMQGISLLSNPAPSDSVFWLPLSFDNFYAKPGGAPTWSPGDQQLAFNYFDYWPPQYYHTNLHILQRDGTWRLCPLENLTWGGAAWSPSGSEVVADNQTSMVVFSASDCSHTRELGGGYQAYPKWSPDGQRIAFSAGPDIDAAIYTVSSTGGDASLLVDDGMQPDWSPDETTIVFVRAKNLWTISVDGTNEHQLTQTEQDEWPAWSRDGSYIAFTRNDPDWFHGGIWLISRSGGSATRVTPNVEGQRRARPCWSHDGTRLTYFVMDKDRYRIGVGIMRDVIPLAVQTRTWSALKKSYR